MADTTATKAKLRRYIEQVGQRAFDNQVRLDTAAVPRGTREHTDGSARLAETRQLAYTATGGSITYPTDVANYLETGTQDGPRIFAAGKALVFIWNNAPIESPRGGNRFFFKSVQHRGQTVHVGWFTDNANAEQWSRSVAGAASQVTF